MYIFPQYDIYKQYLLKNHQSLVSVINLHFSRYHDRYRECCHNVNLLSHIYLKRFLISYTMTLTSKDIKTAVRQSWNFYFINPFGTHRSHDAYIPRREYFYNTVSSRTMSSSQVNTRPPFSISINLAKVTVLTPLKGTATIHKIFFEPMHFGIFHQNLSMGM